MSRGPLVAVVVLAALGAARPARAEVPAQRFAAGPLIGILQIDGKSTRSVGAGAGVAYSRAITDQLELTASLGRAIVAAGPQRDSAATPPNRPAAVGQAGVGLAYVLDLLARWKPWGGVEGGVYWFRGGTLTGDVVAPGGSVGVGLDVELGRGLALGFEGREHFALTKLATYPSYATGLVRLALTWGAPPR